MSKRIRSIPDIPAQTPPYLRPLLVALREALSVRAGLTPNELDRSLTLREMIAENYIHDPNQVKFFNATIDPVFLMNPDEIDTWVDTNVTDLAETRVIVKKLITVVNALVALQR